MSTTQESSSAPESRPSERIPFLSDREILQMAMEQLKRLAARQRTPPVDASPTRMSGLRRWGRFLVCVGVRLLEWVEVVGRVLVTPRHPPGRWLARLRLLMPWQTFNLWKLLLVVFAVLLGLAEFYSFEHSFPFYLAHKAKWQQGAFVAVLGSLFTGAVAAVLLAFWNDLIRCPFLSRRVRRQIRRRPDCVLLSDISRRAVRLVRYEEPIEIVARTDLYDELTPGVLARSRKDVQIVVGDPGSGKTTALIGIAGLLARLGIVPVLVPLRVLATADLVEHAERRFKAQVKNVARSDAEADLLWRWLCRRRRVAILCDNLDRLGSDGERGFQMRQAIKDAAIADLPVIVTARPAGVPAGIAASAIELQQLDEQTAVDCVARGARNDPGFRRSDEVPRQALEQWVHQGKLAAVPFYLEILAQLAAGGKMPRLSEPGSASIEPRLDPRYRRRADGTIEWNVWWVRFLLLEHYHDSVCAGRVRRWQGTETRERTRALRALADAALGALGATACAAQAASQPRAERERLMPERTRLEDFVATDDRDTPQVDAHGNGDAGAAAGAHRGSAKRSGISAQEAIDTGELLRILERDDHGEPEFRHRIMQGYLAGRRLAKMDEAEAARWIELLLERRHPEKLTAQVALVFAALRAEQRARAGSAPQVCAKVETERAADGEPSRRPHEISCQIARALLKSARTSNNSEDGTAPATSAVAGSAAAATVISLEIDGEGSRTRLSVMTREPEQGDRASSRSADLDPMHARDPEDRRDPDDALIKLTTTADIAAAIGLPEREDAPPPCEGRAVPCSGVTQCTIAKEMTGTGLVARWTKLNAITALTALRVDQRWERIWDFAHDPDYQVRQAASAALDEDAFAAYRALHDGIQQLIVRAAARSSLGLALQHAEDTDDSYSRSGTFPLAPWTRTDHERLAALGAVLPAIVSGLREDSSTHSLEAWQGRNGDGSESEQRDGRYGLAGVSQHDYMVWVRRAGTHLEQLVALAFEGKHPDLEAAVAKGFRLDAMRHADSLGDGAPGSGSHAGPGWVASHEHLVKRICLAHADFWYAQLVLSQALALYAIAGGDRQDAFDTLARHLHSGGTTRHPFARRAGRLARAAMRRASLRGERWRTFLWEDEVQGAGRMSVALTTGTAQLLADVTVLLDLNEGAQEDKQQPFGTNDQLPHCLHRSRDRKEILATGCPPECGWNLCPYKQPPADEPNEHRGVSRTFCRQQRRLAWHRRPRWQRRVSRRRLADFWREMEYRARR